MGGEEAGGDGVGWKDTQELQEVSSGGTPTSQDQRRRLLGAAITSRVILPHHRMPV